MANFYHSYRLDFYKNYKKENKIYNIGEVLVNIINIDFLKDIDKEERHKFSDDYSGFAIKIADGKNHYLDLPFFHLEDENIV